MSTNTASFIVLTDISSLSQQDRNALILQLYPKLRRLAAGYYSRSPHVLEIDDLLSLAVLALISAIENYDPSHGVPLWSYAQHRILGSFRDAYRAHFAKPQMSERASMRINNATLRLKARLSREPTHEELASELNLDLPEFYKLYDSAISYELHSLDAPPPTYEGPATEAGDFYANRHSLETQLQRADSPYELALNTQLRAKFTQAVNHLDPQHREVFQLYYQQQLSVRTICKRLGKANRTVAKLLNNSLLQLSATINPSPVPPPTTQRHAQFQPIRPPCKPLSLALSTC